ncbi:MAG: hypothetical protein HY901_16560 [Deltaproteobacteria bacterium]|nr:hypothetical protein [Deltaproteobacteria bacterium]
MAIPPEPIEEVLPKAALVIEAEVEAVLATGPIQPQSDAPPGTTSTGKRAASQTVKLKVAKVHKGASASKELVVEKPLAGYALRVGNKGPFLLDASKPNPVILGRYGPDSWSLDRILQALQAHKR